jgi:large subunit ribosomal protein L21e
MVRKAKGAQAKTRSLLKRGVRERTSINKILEEFKEGSKVVIKVDSSSHQGMPFRRFQGKMGIVGEKRGRSYMVRIKDQNKEKDIIVSPRHLRAI